jgi:4-alpha-glucanotransferase
MITTTDFFAKRRAGILLHITSLPSSLGNGSLGKEAYRFIDFLQENSLSVWQVLPIHPLTLDSSASILDLSPYQPQSVHAGNPLLINLRKLIDRGWLPQMELAYYNQNQLKECFNYRYQYLKKAAIYFFKHSNPEDSNAYQRFVEANQEWLDDYALFRALKDFYQGANWWKWDNKGYRNHDQLALAEARKQFDKEIEQYRFEQFAFFTQWQELKTYAHQNGIYLFGDMPFFVARDSVEVWAYRNNFCVDEQGHLQFYSGVPPEKDYFSSGKGQCWYHPLYHWENLQNTDFKWWRQRFEIIYRLFDLVRLTHFRGFHQCWAISSDNRNKGEWQNAFGEELFARLQEKQSKWDHPLIWVAEDIDAPDVVIKLRNQFRISGIKILQLAFDLHGNKFLLKNYHLPHHHMLRDIVYTGTHDSDTTGGWLEKVKQDKNRQKHVYDYLNIKSIEDTSWSIIKAAFRSVAKLAIIPMQDILNLNSDDRMNTPNTFNNRNWRWQFEWIQLTDEIKTQLKELVETYERK